MILIGKKTFTVIKDIEGREVSIEFIQQQTKNRFVAKNLEVSQTDNYPSYVTYTFDSINFQPGEYQIQITYSTGLVLNYLGYVEDTVQPEPIIYSKQNNNKVIYEA